MEGVLLSDFQGSAVIVVGGGEIVGRAYFGRASGSVGFAEE